MNTVAEITDAFAILEVKEQLQVPRELPKHLKVSPEDFGWLRLAESSFDFWNNPEDAIYDKDG